jgi:hypothetical protein
VAGPLQPIDAASLARLSPAAQKAIAPGPGRMMAARGLLPLPRPAELAAVLYQLVAVDASLASAAQTTADGLPEKVIAGVLADPDAHPQVLDWLAARASKGPALFEALVLNPSIADATVVALAGKGTAPQVDLIAGNEQRLLRCPDVIAAMYANPHARMSTVDRAVELAVRNGIKVSGITAWDELVRVISSGHAAAAAASSDVDAVFTQALSGVAQVADSTVLTGSADDAVEIKEGEDEAPEVDEAKIPISKMSIPMKIRMATLGNAFARSLLVRDPVRLVAAAAIKAPGVTDLEAAKYAGNHSLADDVIRYIAIRRDWTRLYGVKKSLILNPKTPMTESSKLLVHMRDNDLRLIAKSKGVPSAVVAQARKIIMQRGGK